MRGRNRMCVIGFGRMGRHAARLFSQEFQVTVISGRDIDDEVEVEGATLADNQDKALKEADFIFLAVPVEIIKKWTGRINEIVPTLCVVMDCCTARVAAEKELSRINRKRFGIPELHSNSIPIIGEPDKRIEQFFQKQGCKLRKMTPEEYDAATVIIGVAHFLGIALDLSLSQIEHTQLAGAKSGSFLIQLIEHLKTNSSTTYRETQILNHNMSGTRKKFIGDLKRIDEELDNGIFRFEGYPREKWRL